MLDRLAAWMEIVPPRPDRRSWGDALALIRKEVGGPVRKEFEPPPRQRSRISPPELGQEQITIQKPAIARVLEEGIHVRDH